VRLAPTAPTAVLEHEPRRLHERADRAWRLGVAEQDPVYAGCQHLAHHPGIGAENLLVRARGRQGHDHGRRAMPARRGAAVHEPAHKVVQLSDVEWAVLHLIRDVVGPGLRRGAAALVATVSN